MLLILVCLGSLLPAWAQAPLPAASGFQPLPTSVDTVRALRELFDEKRSRAAIALVGLPVGLAATMTFSAVAALEGLSGSTPNTTLPVTGIVAGLVGTTASISRLMRYSRRGEQEVMLRYERTRKLPRWVQRNLRRHVKRGT
ncbi:hypothetical protein GCM10023186_39390 [Hymenobacter koreensis]|uniref:Transmembrane protein n=1 Tax=Hymenobacter koreensis TaxID=1084523 RepID=A0ABP8JH55_9BACT